MRATTFFAVSILSIAAFGCGGPSNELTGIICDCEHCNDWDEEETLAGFQTASDIADAYGCSDDWDTYMTCQIDEGRCDETEADWSVREPGSCTSTMDLGTSCMSDADCNMNNATCSTISMSCVVPACTGGGGQCDTDADCPNGANACQTEQDRLNDCIQKASDHQGPVGP